MSATNNVITDYSNQLDSEILITAETAIKALTGNPYFVFKNNELDNITKSSNAYGISLSSIASSNSTGVPKKDADKKIVATDLKVLSKEINRQANGDLVKLSSTGLPLYKQPTHQIMGSVDGFTVEKGVVIGSVSLKVSKPTTFSDHGTIFAFWKPELGPAPADINDWFFRHSNGHSIVIKGLKTDTLYPFASAYKGSDSDPLIWSPIINKKPYDGY